MESHHGEIQELARPTSPPPPQNIGDEPPKTEETKKDYHKGCPGCQLEEANEIRTGIPYLNFFYICIIGLTSTLPIQSLFPYLYFMIRDMNIAKQEEDIGFYAGFVGASYFFARIFSSVPWGIFADKYGRKPCIVISMLSVIVFNTLFGLSTRYWMAIVSRGLLGMLCGILGPIKAYATEVCRKEHQALGMSLVTSSRAIAFVVGPAIGGFLAQPAEKYPHIFSKESIFGRFPYFLPCFTISILAMGSCIACIWLPETLHFHNDGKVGSADEEAQISEEVEAQVGLSNIEAGVSSDTSLKNLLMNWQFVSSVIIYCTFSLHDVAYLESFSFWAASKRKFGGLSLTSQDLAIVLTISGAGVLVYQFVVYPFIVKYFGPIRPLRPAAILSILLLTTYPFMHNLQGLELKVLINIASILKNVLSIVTYPMVQVQPQKQRGAANGISVTVLSLFKGVGPAGAGTLFSWTQKHVTGLFLPGDQILFLVISMVAVVGLFMTFKPFFSMSNALGRS
ncbi:protein ZINC INDUCED FACILITATOR 1 isoform X2 [Sorghum bicolor]|uniref:protein ZINC INDUCED FACILITATOR 1 isoform X2 n=1 Tax=Sorghum bicolor TaxID=4558 RepID=UPI000B424855|nr:protein ZINC INDUCED FACILITATOR 1 isoform X2 [Sorghum bicolor]|eukprot:XP_021313321.1 protein ZINC INDUCED FACILITATOR 1 isoform X2 [Sorghum bicolor]